jgi:hypothetical protein
VAQQVSDIGEYPLWHNRFETDTRNRCSTTTFGRVSDLPVSGGKCPGTSGSRSLERYYRHDDRQFSMKVLDGNTVATTTPRRFSVSHWKVCRLPLRYPHRRV